MTVNYAVTFEFDTQAPITIRGTVAGSTAPTVVKRALKEAMAAHPGVAWRSLSLCLLERLDGVQGQSTASAADSSGLSPVG